MARTLVVVPTLNEAAHIEATLRALIEGDETGKNAEIVVMDGGSGDATCAIVERMAGEFPNVRLAHNSRKLQSAALNRAVTEARAGYDFLIRCDAHAHYPPGYIAALIHSIETTGADSVVVPMDAEGRGCFQRAVAWIVDTPLGNGGAPHRGGARSGNVDHGHHAAFRLTKFRAIGGYDESFSHNEDAEYDRRLIEAGGRIWLDANIRIGYVPRATASSLWRQYWNYGRGRARMLAKHRLAPAPRQMIPVVNLLLLIGSAIAAPFAPVLAAIWPLLYLSLLISASLLVAVTKRSLCGLLAGGALAIMHAAWAAGFIVADTQAPRGGRIAPSPAPL